MTIDFVLPDELPIDDINQARKDFVMQSPFVMSINIRDVTFDTIEHHGRTGDPAVGRKFRAFITKCQQEARQQTYGYPGIEFLLSTVDSSQAKAQQRWNELKQIIKREDLPKQSKYKSPSIVNEDVMNQWGRGNLIVDLANAYSMLGAPRKAIAQEEHMTQRTTLGRRTPQSYHNRKGKAGLSRLGYTYIVRGVQKLLEDGTASQDPRDIADVLVIAAPDFGLKRWSVYYDGCGESQPPGVPNYLRRNIFYVEVANGGSLKVHYQDNSGVDHEQVIAVNILPRELQSYVTSGDGLKTLRKDPEKNTQMLEYLQGAMGMRDDTTSSLVACFNAQMPSGKNFKQEYIRYMTLQSRLIIEAAINDAKQGKCKNLVLGALGCGAFNNNPYLVAAIFRIVLEKYSDEIVGCGLNVSFCIKDEEQTQQLGRIFDGVLKGTVDQAFALLEDDSVSPVDGYAPLVNLYRGRPNKSAIYFEKSVVFPPRTTFEQYLEVIGNRKTSELQMAMAINVLFPEPMTREDIDMIARDRKLQDKFFLAVEAVKTFSGRLGQDERKKWQVCFYRVEELQKMILKEAAAYLSSGSRTASSSAATLSSVAAASTTSPLPPTIPASVPPAPAPSATASTTSSQLPSSPIPSTTSLPTLTSSALGSVSSRANPVSFFTAAASSAKVFTIDDWKRECAKMLGLLEQLDASKEKAELMGSIMKLTRSVFLTVAPSKMDATAPTITSEITAAFRDQPALKDLYCNAFRITMLKMFGIDLLHCSGSEVVINFDFFKGFAAILESGEIGFCQTFTRMLHSARDLNVSGDLRCQSLVTNLFQCLANFGKGMKVLSKLSPITIAIWMDYLDPSQKNVASRCLLTVWAKNWGESDSFFSHERKKQGDAILSFLSRPTEEKINLLNLDLSLPSTQSSFLTQLIKATGSDKDSKSGSELSPLRILKELQNASRAYNEQQVQSSSPSSTQTLSV